MSHSYKSSLIMSTSALAIALVAPSAGWAQDAQEAQSANRLEEITVTARRVEENVQRVPVAVTVFAPSQLQEQQIVGLKDFMKITPAFSVVTDTGAFAFMRGLQGIVTFFADAPYNLKSTGQLFDVGSVQVLKGPQGTLFGASSVSGVFVMNPKKPTDVFEGFGSVTVGDYGRRTIEGAVGGPIVEDKLLFRIAAQSHSRDGYAVDRSTGKDYFDQNYYVFRPSFIVRPTESIENYTMIQYYYQRDHGRVDNIYAYNPAGLYGLLVNPARADVLLSTHLRDIYELPTLSLVQGFSGERHRQVEVVNNTRWDINDTFSLTNIFMWRSDGRRLVNDAINDGFTGVVTNDPRAIAARTRPLNMQKSWSNETKVQGKLFDDMFNFTLGTFHSGNPAKGELSFSNTRNFLTASKSAGDIRNPAHSRAIFGQTDVDLGRFAEWADGLTFTAGYRYTWDTQISALTNYSLTDPTIPITALPITRSLYGAAKFSYDNWLFGLRYQINPDTMVYVTASKGVTTGQINPQNPPQFLTTLPETLKQIEGGVKSTFYVGDIQARVNVAAYYGWYKNIQSTLTTTSQVNPPPAPPTTLVISANSAAGLVRGIDADFTIIPVEWFEFSGAGAFNKNKYTSWPIFDPVTKVFLYNRSRPFIGNPKLKYNLTGTFNVPMDEEWGKLSISATYAHTSTNWFFASPNIGQNLEYQTTPHFITVSQANGFGPLASAYGAVLPSDHERPFHNLDMAIKWADAAGVEGLTTTLAITNVLKNEGGYGTGFVWFAAGYNAHDPTPPRMFALTMKYAF